MQGFLWDNINPYTCLKVNAYLDYFSTFTDTSAKQLELDALVKGQ